MDHSTSTGRPNGRWVTTSTSMAKVSFVFTRAASSTLTAIQSTNAYVDVWSDNDEGFYDVQQPDIQPPFNNRGIFRTGVDGRYSFVGIKPTSYPIPNDGPVGQMLEQLERHPFRPAHVHFLVGANGYDRLCTHIFVAGDPYLESDSVFGVKDTLIVAFEPLVDATTKWKAKFDFVLKRL